MHGFHAMAIPDLGLRGAKDDELLPRIVDDDRALVTNTALEFRERFRAHAPHHTGIVFLGNISSGRASQVSAFEAAVADIRAQPDIVNVEISAIYSAAGVTVTRSPLP